MNRFFVSDIGPDEAVITGEDLKHLVSVLRLRKGDHVMLSDGRGSECEGEIEHVEPGRAQVKTGPWRPCVSEPHHKLTLFQCQAVMLAMVPDGLSTLNTTMTLSVL